MKKVRKWLLELRDQTARLFEDRALDLGFEPRAGEAQIALDQGSMARVFVNLVQNAIEAAEEPVSVSLASRVEGRMVVVTVADDGPGVPADVQDKLFEPYFTTKSSGTGLGLAICRRLIEAHGGTIRLVSTQPGDTIFAIELPLSAS